MKKFKKCYYVYVILIDCGSGPRFFCVEDIETDIFKRISYLRKRFPDSKFCYEKTLVTPECYLFV